TASAFEASNAASLDIDHQPPFVVPFEGDHSVLRHAQHPRTIAQRSHPSSLVVSTSREDTIQFRMASGIAVSFTRGPAAIANDARRAVGVKTAARRVRAERGVWTPSSTGLHSAAVGPSLNWQKRCIYFGEEPFFTKGSNAVVQGNRQVTAHTDGSFVEVFP